MMGCYGGPGSDSGRMGETPDAPPADGGATCFGVPVNSDPDVGAARGALSIDSLVGSGCSTSAVADLSQQLVDELECLMPGQMERIDSISGLTLGGAVFPYLQRPAADALSRAVAGGGTMRINSGLRTLPQQYLLYRWYRAGRCGISLAASPGHSNHESGLAIDISDNATWRSRLEGEGFRWLGSSDPVHFDYQGGGTTDLRGLSVLAFQRLWNRNHPEDLITEDGLYGPQTESRLSRAPAEGFATGAVCGEPDPPPTEPDPPATDPDPPAMADPTITLEWSADLDGVHVFDAIVPDEVTRVVYLVDGLEVGSAGRSTDDRFEVSVAGCFDGMLRQVTARALDMEGNLVVEGIGWLEAKEEDAIYVRPIGPDTWEIGFDRASSEVAAIEVIVDDSMLTDSVTGMERSPRGAVAHQYSRLGLRSVSVRSYDAAGTLLDERRFDIELR